MIFYGGAHHMGLFRIKKKKKKTSEIILLKDETLEKTRFSKKVVVVIEKDPFDPRRVDLIRTFSEFQSSEN